MGGAREGSPCRSLRGNARCKSCTAQADLRISNGVRQPTIREEMGPNGQPIEYGMFIMPFHPPDKPLVQCYDEDIELVIRTEELGFSEFWIGEHHTMKMEAVVVPEVFIARVLGETKRMRFGPAPICLNQHHPAYVATRLAFLDHLSKGRLNLCFGNSSVPSDVELYGQDPKKVGPMAMESMDVILKLWASDPPYEHNGEFWQFSLKETVNDETAIGYIHKPLQQPHPPIAMPGISRNSYTLKVAGQKGFAPFSAALAAGNVLADNWTTYETAALEAGQEPDRADWKVARAIFLADTTAEAEKLVRMNSVGGNFEYIGGILSKSPLGKGILKRDLDMPDADCNLDYWMSEQIIAGDVDTALERLLSLIEETGPFGKLILMGFDWDDKASWLRNLELFANEFMPALNKEVASVTV